MKLLTVFIAASMLMLGSMSLNAQTKTGANCFSGKWDVIVKGTPSGDSKMIVTLEKKGQELAGSVLLDSASNKTTEITKIELADKSVMLYFNASGYDVFLNLKSKDDDHVTGSLMEMFDAEGSRVKM